MSDVDKYLQKVAPAQKIELERIRKVIKQLAPEAEEVISYGVPAFKLNKKPLIYFAAFKNHMSIFPASDTMVEALGPDLAKMRTSKGTLQFTEAKPIPEALLKDIIKFRLKSLTQE